MPSSHGGWLSGVRYPPLDGLRGLAIIMVLGLHFSRGIIPSTPVDQVYRSVLGTGWLGVDLFFALSGFLITGILLDSRSTPHYYKHFYARRALRILPLYYGFLAVLVVFVVPLVSRMADAWSIESITAAQLAAFTAGQWVFWLFLTNLYIGAVGFQLASQWTLHLWSLALEEQFYLVWPPIVRRAGARSLLPWIVGAVLCAIICRFWLDLFSGANALAAYYLTPARLDVIALGALVAIAVRIPSWQPKLRVASMPACVAGASILLLLLVIRGELSPSDVWVHQLGFPAAAVMFSGLIGRSVTQPVNSGLNLLLSTSFLRSFGKYSYAMYVFHLMVHWAGLHFYASAGVPLVSGSAIPGNVLYVIAAASVTYGLAWMSWHLFESHFLKLSRHFRDTPGEGSDSMRSLSQPGP